MSFLRQWKRLLRPFIPGHRLKWDRRTIPMVEILEDRACPDANSIYVGNLYAMFLHRPADAAGAAYWTGLLNQGVAPSTVVLDIEHSQEYETDLVTGIYHQYLKRNPDPGGLNYWVGQLAAGTSVFQVEADFCASKEYVIDHSDNTLNFVEGLYTDILSRTPALSEAQGWAKQINAGMSRLQVALDFLYSNEYLTDHVTAVYDEFLQQAPGSASLASLPSLASWVAQLQGGLTDQQFTADIAGSPQSYAIWSVPPPVQNPLAGTWTGTDNYGNEYDLTIDSSGNVIGNLNAYGQSSSLTGSLTANGNSVSGNLYWEGNSGSVTGTVNGNSMTLEWTLYSTTINLTMQ